MNLGIFNRVNLKECEGSGMYSEWASLANIVRDERSERESVLTKFSPDTGKEVAVSVVRELSSTIGLTQAPSPSRLVTHRDVLWSMEVICYGLSLPLADHDAIRDCVHIYCDWMTVLHPVPNISVPKPLLDDPNLYARKMIVHLHNLFIPRKGEVWAFLYSDLGADTIKRQAVLCHRVLRTLQQAAQCSTIMSHETWQSLLVFLLAINEELLATPTIKDDVGDQLCERVLSVLFEVWLVACAKSFPGPPLWRTLREMAITWRHRTALITTWARVCLALTHRLIAFVYPPSFPKHQFFNTFILSVFEDIAPKHSFNNDNDHWTVPTDLSDEKVAQAWFRFLHTIGSPVDLSRPQVISQTPKFLQYAMVSDTDPSSHPCLSSLPINFLIGIKGISNLVDTFLGIPSEPLILPEEETKKETPTPPPHRRPAKSFSVSSVSQKGASKSALIGLAGRTMSTASSSSMPATSTTMTSISGSWEISSANTHPLAPARPKCNSLLHLFGEWLFEAAQTGTGLYANPNLTRESSSRRSGSLGSNTSDSLEADISISSLATKYQAGRANALAALCRIFCSKKTGEQILPVYYSRFYLVLFHGLKLNEKRDVEEPLVSILLNCADLLRLDLDGIQILVPHILDALERVLPDKDLIIRSNVSVAELRRASIHLLLSMLPLPLHFPNLIIKDLLSGVGDKHNPLLFGQLKCRVMNLLINALQVETDAHNTHLLLGGLLVMVQDTASVEKILNEKNIVQNPVYPTSVQTSDSANSLFVKATYLVCHRLISSWKGDLGISLAALELLCGLANSGIKDIEHVEWERGMKWVCDYIVYQCWRPPQAHSKDLHSSVVAAFTTVSVWIMAHPQLLQSRHCLHNVLEVIELGISGVKSQGKRKDEPLKMKDEKELKPVSMRVRDAAEALLTIVLEHAGYFPSPCGPESVSSMVDESVLLKYSSANSMTSFKYFVLHSSILLALLEDPLGNYQEPQPVVNVILRGGFGRHAWNFQLRQLPRHKSSTNRGRSHSGPGRPIHLNMGPQQHVGHHAFFPDNISRIPQCAAERSIPELEGDTNEMSQLLRVQTEIEKELAERPTNLDRVECTPPGLCAEFQTARLFLSHFGFINKLEGGRCSIVALDSKKDSFFKEIEFLDKMEPRTSDTCHVFYVRAGQSHYQDILANVESKEFVSNNFLQILGSLGWPINVPGSNQELEKNSGSGGGRYSGHKEALYWADSMSQMTFLVPTLKPLPFIRHHHAGNDERSKRQITTYPVFVVWLESLEDHVTFPLEDMVTHTGCGQEGWHVQHCTVIFLHALQSGLFRVKLQPSPTRPSVATPLVDGIVVSRTKVGSFVRQTALNICRRKRLDNESYQPPPTRRRLKIQEIATKFEIKGTRADLLTSLFS
ncbi:ral GTPase-activating protein subunit beta isoform X3 [Rhodnius prolixus]|uniref:ral GTPase-activating protein subunit beta isoform X3 n=1 Tax=Rhodnius prolixus TaxID=13249 RepID=UPI003D188B22